MHAAGALNRDQPSGHARQTSRQYHTERLISRYSPHELGENASWCCFMPNIHRRRDATKQFRVLVLLFRVLAVLELQFQRFRVSLNIF